MKEPKKFLALVVRSLYNRETDTEDEVTGTFELKAQTRKNALTEANSILGGSKTVPLMQTIDSRITWERESDEDESYVDWSFELVDVEDSTENIYLEL